MNESWSDLTPLDPERDPARWEALLRRTRAAAAAELSRRAFAAGPAAPLLRFVRPALALAASLVIAAGSLLALADGGEAQQTPSTAPGVAEALGVPVATTGWMEDGVLGTPDPFTQPDGTEAR
jgi:hypothetical protein